MRKQGANGWIGVDLDGTLAVHNSGDGVDQIGEPIAPMVERVKNWLAQGIEVRVFTARLAFDPDHPAASVYTQHRMICDWCKEHIGQELRVTSMKDFNMIELWDDRCVQVIPNTGQPAI